MIFFVKDTALNTLKTDLLVLTVDSKTTFKPKMKIFNSQTNGLLKKTIARDNFKGALGETMFFSHLPGVPAERVLLVGIGDQKKLTAKAFMKLISTIVKLASGHKIENLALDVVDLAIATSKDMSEKIGMIVSSFYESNYNFNEQKNHEVKTNHEFKKITLLTESKANFSEIKSLIKRFSGINQGVNLAKNLANRSANVCTPRHLANEARKIGKRSDKLTIKVIEEKEMLQLGMGSFLAVARGSTEPAKLIIANYKGANKNKKPVVLIGKGVTFDSGGISLKPGAGMDEMKYDMGGAASVLGCVEALAVLEPKINVVALIPATENMPDGKAIKPGDIVKSMSGKTIEILNTDAEGRLILCDALTYCSRFNPDCVIDIATLTGACVVALGKHATGLLSNHDDFADEILKAGEKAHDRAWQLPLWDEYRAQLNSPFADIANVGGRFAGTITAAIFLSAFAENYKWAHLDIAGTAWHSGALKGATGRPVPLLMEFLLRRASGSK